MADDNLQAELGVLCIELMADVMKDFMCGGHYASQFCHMRSNGLGKACRWKALCSKRAQIYYEEAKDEKKL